MAYTESNASSQALRLLGQFLSSESETLHRLWEILTRVLQESNDTVRFREDSWEQDWFLAKYGAEDAVVGTRAWYAPPKDFLGFPTFDLDDHLRRMERSGISVTPTKSATDPSVLFTQEPATAFTGPMVLDDFYELQGRIRTHGDPAMAELNQVVAWFNTGLGRLFGGIALTPNLNLESALAVLARRWSNLWREKDVYEDTMSMPEILQWKLDVFYGAEIAPDKLLMQPSRQGQSRQWQKYWQWMSAGVEPNITLAATQMAARLMVCPPILVFLKSRLREAATGDVLLEHLLTLVIVRRLVLELQAMSWLELALQNKFRDLRTQDLASFAFGACRPHWPRRLFALSHRSKDIKPTLMKLAAWGNFRYSIDAMFAPHWETNVATVWGLFSAVPGLIRVASEQYDNSEWCRREGELFDYLRDSDDFLHGRYVIEMNEAQLPAIDTAIPIDSEPTILAKKGNFPPRTYVFIVYPIEAWESKLLASAAAVRFIFLQLRDAGLTAFVCQHLARGNLPPPEVPPLTNHPDRWAPIATLFQEFQRDWGNNPAEFPITVDAKLHSEEEIDRDLASSELLIDLSDGLVDQVAALAALEWNRTVLPSLIANYRYGSFCAVDYRRLTQESWRTDECMVIRGANRVFTSVPLWILQRADQRVDEWPGIGTNPIFTQHQANQWHWMWELLQPPEWPDIYRTDCKLAFSAKLTTACAATKTRDSSYYRGKVS
jgi:hypothetical protein